MLLFRAGLWLQLLVLARAVDDPPTESPPATDQQQIFNCENNLDPDFMVDLFCHFTEQGLPEKSNPYTSAAGLVISDEWVLSSGYFLSNCLPLLHEDHGCLVGHQVNGINCEEITVFENYSITNSLSNDLGVVKTAGKISSWTGVVPWPLKPFSNKCTDFVIYGNRTSESTRRCLHLQLTGRECLDGTYKVVRSVICAQNLDLDASKELCEGDQGMGLAVCDGVVVGVFSKKITQSKCESNPVNFALAKIDNVYSFIETATGVKVPFQSSPVSEETTTATTANDEDSTEVANCEDEEVANPTFFARLRCDNNGENAYGSGFVISHQWVLTSASFMTRHCKAVEECSIEARKKPEVKCLTFHFHDKFDVKEVYHYDIALIEAPENAFFVRTHIPWPTTKGFTDKCTEVSFYSYKYMKNDFAGSTCVTQTLVGLEECADYEGHHHSKDEAILCSHNKDPRQSCRHIGRGSLAVCDNIVVGIFSHNHTKPACDVPKLAITYVLTKIEDYYTFIQDKTGIAMPFTSEPSGRSASSSAVGLNCPWLLLLALSCVLLVLLL